MQFICSAVRTRKVPLRVFFLGSDIRLVYAIRVPALHGVEAIRDIPEILPQSFSPFMQTHICYGPMQEKKGGAKGPSCRNVIATMERP